MVEQKQHTASAWTLVLKPKSTLSLVNLIKSVWEYKDLLVLLVRRDFVAQYKQTVLGPTWFFIQPILSTIVFTIIFGKIAGLNPPNIPPLLFYLSGITLWNYFADCFNKTADTFTLNAHIFGKVYFPRIIVPLSIIVSNLIKLGVQLILFLAVYFYFFATDSNIQPNMYITLLPLLILMMGGLGLGFGLLFSALTTKYRDLKFLLQFGVQLMMYGSSIVFPLSKVEGNYKLLILANPVSSIIEAFKYAFLGEGTFSWMYLLYSFVFMMILLFIGSLTFNSIEKSFMDTV